MKEAVRELLDKAVQSIDAAEEDARQVIDESRELLAVAERYLDAEGDAGS